MHTVVKTAFAALPELDAIGGETIAPPVFRTGDFNGIGGTELSHG